MGLLSSLKIGKKSAAPATPSSSLEAADIVREARTRARRRLIGAAVLLGIGIIGFPLLFESRPRPIPVDIAIEIPPREGAPAMASPALAKSDAHRPDGQPAEPIDEPPASAAASSVDHGGKTVAAATGLAAAGVAAIASRHDEAAKPATPASGVKADAKAMLARPGSSTSAKAVPKTEPRSEAKADEKAKDAAAKARDREAASKVAAKPAQRPLEKPTEKSADKATESGRFVVQVGAFAEVATAHEARMKVERLGLKTYTQAVDTAAGRRIRVRVGPFASKTEADKAATRIKAGGGLPAAVLTL